MLSWVDLISSDFVTIKSKTVQCFSTWVRSRAACLEQACVLIYHLAMSTKLQIITLATDLTKCAFQYYSAKIII